MFSFPFYIIVKSNNASTTTMKQEEAKKIYVVCTLIDIFADDISKQYQYPSTKITQEEARRTLLLLLRLPILTDIHIYAHSNSIID